MAFLFTTQFPSPLLAFQPNPAVQRLSGPGIVAVQFRKALDLSGRNSHRIFKDEPCHISSNDQDVPIGATKGNRI